jgi:hypothetical protein
MSLTKEQILAAQDLVTEKVDTPEWGGEVFVRMMTAAEVLAFHAANAAGDDNSFARLAAATIVDEAGNRLFTDDEAAKLREKSHVVMTRVVTAALKLNGLANGQKDELKND